MAAGDIKASNNLATGQVAGTGSAIGVVCGFRPKVVQIINQTTKTRGLWTDIQAADSADLIVDSGVGTTDLSTISSGGITSTFNGFSIGTNSSLNANGNTIYWIAQK